MRTLGLDAGRPDLLVVVHHRDLPLTQANVAIAADGGADGVFLIDHAGDDEGLLGVATQVRAQHPDLWMGVNLLGSSAARAMELVAGHDVDGVWSDAAGIDLDGSPRARETLEIRQRTGFTGCYFGGVEFKYQPSLGDARRAAEAARGLVDVITTSGPGTGHAADLAKLEQMRVGADGVPLAVASGVTPDNAGALVGVVEAVLVATGISRDFHHLDVEQVVELRRVLG